MNDVSPVVKTIVCLANSRKHGGRCVAGKLMEQGLATTWLRPVSARADGTLSLGDIRFENGNFPNVLDILEIPVKRPLPQGYQCENYLIDDAYSWASEARFRGNLSSLCDEVDALWSNGCRSAGGVNDRVPLGDANAVRSSLLLIEPDALRIRVVNSGEKKSVRARFCYRDVWYDLKVTDPVIEAHYQERPACIEIIKVRPLYLCVSLGVPFEGYIYKLVASIIGLGW